MSPGEIAQGGLRNKLRNHIFEFASALAWMLVGINYLVDSQAAERSPVGQALYPFDYMWATMYVVAAPLIFAGIMKASQRVRVAGLTLLGTGLFMHFIGAVSTTPFESRDFIYACYAVACLLRALLAAETVHPVVKRARG